MLLSNRENWKCLWRHGNKVLLLLFSRSILPPFKISLKCFGLTSHWIESSLTSGAEHSSANLLYPVQTRRVGEWWGGLCYWGMHVKRHWRPLKSRLLIHCHIMDHLGQEEPEKMMHVLKFTTFPEVCGIDPSQQTMLIFSDKCLFNLDSLCNRNAPLSPCLCTEVICWRPSLRPRRAFSKTSIWNPGLWSVVSSWLWRQDSRFRSLSLSGRAATLDVVLIFM